MFNRYRRVLLYGITAVILVGASFLLWDQALARRPFPTGAQITVKTSYDLCRHEISKTLSSSEIGVLTLKELRSLYPSRDGWRAQVKAKDVVVARAVDGEVVRVTKTRVEILPPELRLKVSAGTLDLPDEESLLQILDSLEEDYQ